MSADFCNYYIDRAQANELSLAEQLISRFNFSHKKWKALKKKEKRKLERQRAAREQEQIESELNKGDSEGSVGTEDEQERQWQHNLWLQREAEAQREWKWKKQREEKERLRLEEEERRIKEEWEERQREEKEREEKEAKRKVEQERLLKEATANEKKVDGEAWHNPIAPVQYGEERKVELCPFFMKTGACRFGERCSRGHDYPESSCTLLFPGMYAHFSLEQALHDEYDTDFNLEYEDTEMRKHFDDFYRDIVPEFKKIGQVLQVKVCRNYEPHLRGNVYIQYRRPEEADEAFVKFNARWYGGRQLNCQYTHVDNWKAAICGLYFSKRCPKGKSCNFLHVFRNPGNEFGNYGQFNRGHNNHHGNRNYNDINRERRPSARRSRSRERSSKRRSRSRSREKSRRRENSVERSRRSRSRSKDRSRSRSREHSRRRVKVSGHRSRHRSRSRSREREKTPDCDGNGDNSDGSSDSYRKRKTKKKHKKHKKHSKKGSPVVKDRENSLTKREIETAPQSENEDKVT